jgi:hypothetical protein
MADTVLTESYDFVQRAVAEFVDVIETLAEHLGDEDIRKLILADLGLDPTSGAQLEIPAQNMDSVRAYLDRTDTDLEAFLAVVDDAAQIIDAIASFIEVASAEPNGEDAIRELVFELVMFSSLLQYRYKYPTALAVAEMLAVVDYGIENYDQLRVVTEQLGRILSGLGNIGSGLLDTVFGWKVGDATVLTTEDDARTLSDLFLIPFAGVLTYVMVKKKPTRLDGSALLYGWDILDPDDPQPGDAISNRILSLDFKAKYAEAEKKLLTLGQQLSDTLDARTVTDALKDAFADAGHALGSEPLVVVKQPGKKWLIVDEDRFTIRKEGDAINVFDQPPKAEVSRLVGITFVPRDDGGPGLFVAVGAGEEATIPLSNDWSVKLAGKAPAALGFFLNLDDVGASQFFGPGDVSLSLAFSRKDQLVLRRARLPDIDGTDISFGSFEFGVSLTTQKIELKAVSKSNTLLISGESADGFIRRSLPAGKIQADFSVGLALELLEPSLRFTEGTRIEVVIPLGKEVLGVRIVYVTLALTPVGEGTETRLGIEASASLSLKFGPFTSAIDRIGLAATLPPPRDEDDEVDWSQAFRFKPPTGVGFAIDASAVSGGGFLFFDRDSEEYAGVLQLRLFERFWLKAIGLISTKLPRGEDGFSILAIASVEFDPGFQLVWGFTLEGAGLLVGVNRSMVLDVLREGVRNGTLDTILFPDDPVRDAPRLISALRTVFPTTPDRHVFGFLLSLSWAGLKNSFDIELGVVLEVPSPVRLVILGQVAIFLPTKKLGVVDVRFDVVGIWDQAAQSISVDAALRDSNVGGFPLTGEMAARGSWGTERVFIIAAGGVHPSFNPPAALPALKRLQIALGGGDNPRLRLLGYLAITANTFQVGAKAELFAKASGFTLEGWAGVDALFEFDPFRFVADFSAGVKISRGSRVLFSLTLEGTLEAFTPIRVSGNVRFRIFFVKFSIPVNLTLGNARTAVLEAVDVQAELIAALSDRTNWAGELTGRRDSIATVRDTLPDDALMVHPLGALSVRQQVVPLDIDIELFRSARPAGVKRFAITALEVNGSAVARRTAREYFAPAQYFELSDDEKLARPSFEELPAGTVADSDAFAHGQAVVSDLTYETILIDRGNDRVRRLPRYDLSQVVLEAVAVFGASGEAAGQSGGPGKYRVESLGIRVAEPAWSVAGIDDLEPPEDDSPAGTYTEVLAALRRRRAERPAETRGLQIVGVHERVTP